jgi:hypothetical protein
MQDAKAPAGEGRIGKVFVAIDKLEAAVHAGRLRSGQTQPALSGQWRSS